MNKKFIWIGIGALAIIIVIVGVVVFNGNAKGPDSIIKQYCDILKNGNYGDIIDIAYFPESELITKEKLEEKKKQYFEEMRNSNSTNVTKYEYSKTNEDDEKISYKVVLNGTDVKNVDLLKSENKLLIEDLYEERSLKVKVDSKVYVDGVELTNVTPVDDYYDTYNFIALKNVDYNVKITHIYLNDIDTDLNFKIDNEYSYIFDTYWKPEMKEKFYEDIEEVFRAIIRYYQQGGDLNDLNRYFVNDNASEFITDMKDNFYSSENAKYVDNYNFYMPFYHSEVVQGRPASILMEYPQLEGSGKGSISFKDKEYNWEDGRLALEFDNIVFLLVDGKFKISSWKA